MLPMKFELIVRSFTPRCFSILQQQAFKPLTALVNITFSWLLWFSILSEPTSFLFSGGRNECQGCRPGIFLSCSKLHYFFDRSWMGWKYDRKCFWNFPGLFQCLILIPAKLSDIVLQRLFVECLTPMLPFV